MKVQLSQYGVIKSHTVEVKTFQEASLVVREFIRKNDCTAGCGERLGSFEGGEVFSGTDMIARVSYNGRVWDLDGKELV